jgi:16S rRNA (guanine527-N7)-methyltransferase
MYGPEEFARDFAVSRETIDRFRAYESTLRAWQAKMNLVAPSTIADVWRRHLADSAQLFDLAPDWWRWADLGSGAGFPGLVIAILAANQEDREVHLVESNSRKCAFLGDVARRTGAKVVIHDARVETVAAKIGAVDVVSARALAPLSSLLALAEPFFGSETVGLFPKGRDALEEIAQAQGVRRFQWKTVPSRTDSEGQIVKIWAIHSNGDERQ